MISTKLSNWVFDDSIYCNRAMWLNCVVIVKTEG